MTQSRREFVKRAPAALLCALPAFPVLAASRQRIDIRRHGARGDGQTLNTAAIQAAIEACAAAGGGMSVSRFSMRSISGSLPAAAATLSIENPGIPFSRSPTGRHYPGAGGHAPRLEVRRECRSRP